MFPITYTHEPRRKPPTTLIPLTLRPGNTFCIHTTLIKLFNRYTSTIEYQFNLIVVILLIAIMSGPHAQVHLYYNNLKSQRLVHYH